jgi:exonuclease SbcD
LEALRIHVVGEKAEAPEAMLVPLQDRAGHTQALVSAVPFLRDADLRRLVEGETALQREEAVREGIARVFREQAEAAVREARGAPCIAMGHLFAYGENPKETKRSDSERDIQVGNLAGVSDQVFPEIFDYVALGHIHKPQKVGREERIFYAGSPVPLSFSESQDQKRVILLEVGDEGIQHESLPVPAFCRLPRFKGPLEHIRQKLETLVPGQDALIEVHLVAERDHPDLPVQLNELVAEHNRHHPDQPIIQQRIEYGDRTAGAGQLFEQEQDLDALSPEAVFRERLKRDQPDSETRALLEEAFQEILDEIRQSENS